MSIKTKTHEHFHHFIVFKIILQNDRSQSLEAFLKDSYKLYRKLIYLSINVFNEQLIRHY